MKKVSDLIYGYESPFGMELLAITDCIMQENPKVQPSSTTWLQSQVHQWNSRNEQIFKPHHLESAKKRLNTYVMRG